MQNRDKLIEEISDLWQDLLNEDPPAEDFDAYKKAALLCKEEVSSRINFNEDTDVEDNIYSLIFVLVFLKCQQKSPDTFVDALDEEILNIPSYGNEVSKNISSKIWLLMMESQYFS